jgi:predicted ATP-dependent endonuclease of OLD family
MSQVFLAISENNYDRSKNFIIMIDEPDLHLHIRRQKEYIKTLIENFMRFT